MRHNDHRDHEAYRTAAHGLRPELRRSALRMTRSEADADDLVQETLTRAWTFWSTFEPSTNVRAWMHRIQVNAFINGYRRKRRERDALTTLAREDAPASPRRPEPSLELVGDEVKRAVEALQPEYRHAVVMVDLFGLSYAEAADAAGCPVGTIMSRLHRGRRGLRRSLEAYGASFGFGSAAAA
jgi:RNA polymerase sigma-70 factor (ECF subfamily)